MKTVHRGRWVPISVFAIGLLGLTATGIPYEGSRKHRVPVPSASKPWSLLIITVDTLRADYVRLYDTERGVTRNMDRIAEGGVVFTHAFAHAPLTLPSHTSIFTGLTPAEHGVHDNAGFRVTPDTLTLAEWLAEHGYRTAAFVGAFPLDKRFGLDQGFATYDDLYISRNPYRIFFAERRAEAVIDRTLAWLRQHGQRFPWFVWVHLFDPHQPYDPPPPFRSGRWAQDPYGGEVAYTDRQIGRLLDFLHQQQWWDRTVVVMTSDHGEDLGDHGENTHGLFVYNSTVHVPLLMHIPGRSGPPQRIPWFVGHMDIFPTVCGILGLPVPRTVRGRNLWPWLRDGRAPPRDPPIYIEAMTAYLNRRWAPVLGIIWRHMKFIDTPIPELYDLRRDFAERKNLASTRDVRPFRKRLRQIVGRKLPQARAPETPETLEILRSLGYAATGGAGPRKTRFTPEDDPKRLLPVHRAFMEAVALYGRGHLDAAIERMKTVISQRRDMVIAYTYLVTFYREKGDFRRAIQAAQMGLRVAPDEPELLSQLGQALVEAGHYTEGIRTLRMAIERRAFDADVWNYLGIAYWQARQWDRAERAFRRALAIDDTDAIVWNNLGNLYISMQRYTDAEQAYRRALDIDPALASAYNGIGTARLAQGDWRGAYRAWKQALKHNPEYPLALYNLGMELYRRGRTREAREYLRRYLEVAGRSISNEEFQKIDRILREGSPE